MFKIMCINFYVFFGGSRYRQPKFLPGKNLKLRFPVIFFKPSGGQGAGGYQKDLVCNGLCQETAETASSLPDWDQWGNNEGPIYLFSGNLPSLSGSM